jgi:hypothetical protein
MVTSVTNPDESTEGIRDRTGDLLELLRAVRHAIDHGTGSGVIGRKEDAGALDQRIEAHECLSCIENLVEEIRGISYRMDR